MFQLLALSRVSRAESVALHLDESLPQAAFAAAEIRSALQSKGHGVVDAAPAFTIDLELKAKELPAQGYAIDRPAPQRIRVVGGDARGLMYGGLELAERIRLTAALEEIQPVEDRPYIEQRGLKFNLPLDARTPSYDDTGDAAQENIAQMWRFDFWREFLDEMARDRYNALTFWVPHPFPSMIRLQEYPDVALDDVCVTTLKPVAEPGVWAEPQLVSARVLENLKVIKKISIDEKIAFWRRVMRHAKERGIDIYFITWNVCLNSVAPPGRNRENPDVRPTGKYGISNDLDNQESIRYLRACVREFILTYPDLAGLGATAGENMPVGDAEAKEKWLWRTYGLGVADARKEQPKREIRFIHRVWWSGIPTITKAFADYPGPFELSFKYARAHLYSATRPPFADALLPELKRAGLRCWWNLRNDDLFNFRWGDPDYVREFIRNFDHAQTAGYHLGSDGYVWGREFTSLEPEHPRELELRKHWFSFLLWGRLGYNPDLDRSLFERLLALHFPEANPALLYDTWTVASKIPPQVTRFHWRDWDFQWYVEGCLDVKGFHSVEDFIRGKPMDGSGLLAISDYARAVTGGKTISKVTPLQVADDLDFRAETALAGVKRLRTSAKISKELRQTLTDIECLADLGRYYAAKIRGATELQFYRVTHDIARQERSIASLQRAVGDWDAYARAATSQYRPQLLARTRELDWWSLAKAVEHDVELARGDE